MWTPTTRLQHSRDERRYSIDLIDAERGVIETLLPPACRLGRLWLWPKRELVNGIFYVICGDTAWRLLTKDCLRRARLRPFQPWRDSGLFAGINHQLAVLDRDGAVPALELSRRSYVHHQGLHRRGLCRRQDGGCHPYRRRDRPHAARTGRLRGPPTSMGRGALLRLDQPPQEALNDPEAPIASARACLYAASVVMLLRRIDCAP